MLSWFLFKFWGILSCLGVTIWSFYQWWSWWSRWKHPICTWSLQLSKQLIQTKESWLWFTFTEILSKCKIYNRCLIFTPWKNGRTTFALWRISKEEPLRIFREQNLLSTVHTHRLFCPTSYILYVTYINASESCLILIGDLWACVNMWIQS